MPLSDLATHAKVANAAAARYKAMREADGATLQGLTHDDFVFVHSTGGIEHKQDSIAVVADKIVVYEAIDPIDRRILFGSETVVIIIGRVAYRVSFADQHIAFEVNNTDAWVNVAGTGWQIISSHSSNVAPDAA